jgi:hypothetical protein
MGCEGSAPHGGRTRGTPGRRGEEHNATVHCGSAAAYPFEPPAPVAAAPFPVVHVSPDGRKVYIGEEGDATIHGGSIMAFAKSWKSGPIHSWSGGKKLADMPGK